MLQLHLKDILETSVLFFHCTVVEALWTDALYITSRPHQIFLAVRGQTKASAQFSKSNAIYTMVRRVHNGGKQGSVERERRNLLTNLANEYFKQMNTPTADLTLLYQKRR